MSHAPMPLVKVLDILQSGAGTQFDSQVVAAFVQCLEQILLRYRGSHFPPEYVDGVMERLQSRETA